MLVDRHSYQANYAKLNTSHLHHLRVHKFNFHYIIQNIFNKFSNDEDIFPWLCYCHKLLFCCCCYIPFSQLYPHILCSTSRAAKLKKKGKLLCTQAYHILSASYGKYVNEWKSMLHRDAHTHTNILYICIIHNILIMNSSKD
jgi:hypothetical protein